MFGIGGFFFDLPLPPPKGEWVAIIFVGFSFDLPLPPPKGEWGSYNFYWLYVKFIFIVQKYIIFFNYQIAVNH